MLYTPSPSRVAMGTHLISYVCCIDLKAKSAASLVMPPAFMSFDGIDLRDIINSYISLQKYITHPHIMINDIIFFVIKLYIFTKFI